MNIYESLITCMLTRGMCWAGSMMGTQDLQGGQLLQYKGTLRALIWLFKADQPDGWYVPSSGISLKV